MNDTEADRDLQRLFAAYDPALRAQPFLERTSAALHGEIRRARRRMVLLYVCSATLIAAVAAMTATPLSAATAAIDRTVHSLARELSPAVSQIFIYATTLGLIALARRRIRAFLEPW